MLVMYITCYIFLVHYHELQCWYLVYFLIQCSLELFFFCTIKHNQCPLICNDLTHLLYPALSHTFLSITVVSVMIIVSLLLYTDTVFVHAG